MTSQQDRFALEERLRQVLGNQPATTLLAMLPAHDELATKGDLAALGTELRTDIAELHSELGAMRQEMELKYATKADLTEMKNSFDTAFHSYVRTFIATQAATVVGMTGIFYALVRLT